MSESSSEVKLYPLRSSHLDKVGYDPATKTLHVLFKDGTHYTYHKVPPHVFSALLRAESPGSHFHAEIKSKYRARKL